ncbi:MAG: bifunctional UDP-sugar hydrolase/5'-nucleotidase [Lachnospiraceae bacterium]
MKKKITKGLAFLLVPILAVGLLGVSTMAEEKQTKELNVVFTNDLHSRLNSFYLKEEGEKQLVGGFARISTYLEEKRSQDENLLFADAGDFAMGTLYQTIYETHAAELRMLGNLGLDVGTIGNHEFDYRSKGLANMLKTAKDSGDTLPELVVCNVDWKSSLASERVEECKELQSAFENYGIKPYVMLEKGDVKIAVIGVFGVSAKEFAPTCALEFKDPVEAVKETVAEIKAKEKADIIVCVSHSGIWPEADKSEDELLAKGVPDLDLIISGHTHTTLEKPIVHGNTAIVSTGEYGARIGSLQMVQNEKGRWKVENYELTLLDDSFETNAEIQKKIDELGECIDREYLAQFGYTKDQVLTYNPWEFANIKGLGTVLQEETLGNLLADAYLYGVNHANTQDENPVVVAAIPSGCVRDSLFQNTNVTVSNAFQTLSLGIGPDGIPGYPMISIYLTGKELRTMAEVDASISPILVVAQLYTSGISYKLNPNRLILNRVTDTELQDMEGKEEKIQEDKLYRVVADLYTGHMLGTVKGQSFGILSIVPKDINGKEIPKEELEDYIVYKNGRELKGWVCVAEYLDSFEKVNGSSTIPQYYSTTHERKIVEDDSSLGAVLKNPNRIAVVMISIAAGAVILLILFIALIVKLVKKARKARKAK